MTKSTELWDILDEHGKLTGRAVERGRPLKDGEYQLVVHIWIRNSKGEYLIQKRSDNVDVWPGIWGVAGGSALKGESSLTAALREVKEELGISFEPDMPERITRVKYKNVFSDLWLVRRDVSLEDVKLQKEEVSEVRYAVIDEILKMISNNEFIDFGKCYLSLLA